MVVASAGFGASSQAQALQLQSFNFSYTYSDGALVVSGVLDGYAPTGLTSFNVTDPNVVSLAFNNISAGPASVTGWGGSPLVVSTDTTLDDFQFWAGASFFQFVPPSLDGGVPYTSASSALLNLSDADWGQSLANNLNPNNNQPMWVLTADATIPDGGYTAMLCGMSLVVLGWLRRKLA